MSEEEGWEREEGAASVLTHSVSSVGRRTLLALHRALCWEHLGRCGGGQCRSQSRRKSRPIADQLLTARASQTCLAVQIKGDGALQCILWDAGSLPDPSPPLNPLPLQRVHLDLPSALCSQVCLLHRPPGLGQGQQVETYKTGQARLFHQPGSLYILDNHLFPVLVF